MQLKNIFSFPLYYKRVLKKVAIQLKTQPSSRQRLQEAWRASDSPERVQTILLNLESVQKSLSRLYQTGETSSLGFNFYDPI